MVFINILQYKGHLFRVNKLNRIVYYMLICIFLKEKGLSAFERHYRLTSSALNICSICSLNKRRHVQSPIMHIWNVFFL